MRLGALAELFGTATRPTHRALADARATVEVLHHLLERIGNLGVQSLEELLTLVRDATPHRPTERQRRNRHLAESVPSAPGVYLFRGARDEVLYVGTSGDLRRRVRSYFTAGERRRRIRDMVAQARAGRRDRVRARPGGGGARAAADRRAPAPLQPPLPQPARDVVGDGDGRGVPAAVGGRHAARRRARAVPLPQRDAREAVDTVLDAVPLRPCTQRIPARGAAGEPVRPVRAAPVRRAVRRAPGRRRLRPRRGDLAATWSTARTTARCTPSRTRSPRSPARERFEAAARRRDRLAGLVGALGRGAAAGRAGRARGGGRRPARRARGLGAGGRAARPARRGRGRAAAACRRCPWSRRCGPAPRRCCRGPGRCAARPPRRCGCCTAG